MKYFFTVLVFCFVQMAAIAQNALSNKQTMEQLEKSQKELAETMENMKRRTDSINKASMEKRAEWERTMMMKTLHEEQVAKKKRQAFMYLGLGLFFAVVLVVGLRRKSVKTQK